MIEIKYMCSNGKEYNLVGNRMRPTCETVFCRAIKKLVWR